MFPRGSLIRINEWYTVARDPLSGHVKPNVGTRLSSEDVGAGIAARLVNAKRPKIAVADPSIFVADVVMRAESRWSMNDDGKLVPTATDAEHAYDDTGRPLSPEAWLDGLRTTAPHLFEASAGGGASGGSSGDGGPVRVRAKADLRTPKEKSAYIEKHGLDAFTKLPLTVR